MKGSGAARSKRNWRRAQVLALLALALGLRAHRLGDLPAPFATADEYHFLWSGLSLLRDGRPTAWSMLGVYRGKNLLGHTDSAHGEYPLASPALDHPPLFSLLAAGWAQAVGAARPAMIAAGDGRIELWDIDFGRARILALALFCATYLLIYDLAARRFGHSTAILALVFYGGVSHIAVHNRLLVTENLTTPLFLFNLALFERLRLERISEKTFGWATAALTAAALLAKVVAVSQGAAVAILLLAAGRRRAALWPIAGGAAGLAAYLAYGYLQDWSLFLETLSMHGSRFDGFDALEKIVTRPQLIHRGDFDAPLFLAWLALPAAILTGRRRGAELLGAGMTWLMAYVFFASVPGIYGWHVLPLYPFLSMGMAVAVGALARRPDFASYSAALAITLPALFESVHDLRRGWDPTSRFVYLAIGALALVSPHASGESAPKVRRIWLCAVFAALLLIDAGRGWFLP